MHNAESVAIMRETRRELQETFFFQVVNSNRLLELHYTHTHKSSYTGDTNPKTYNMKQVKDTFLT